MAASRKLMCHVLEFSLPDTDLLHRSCTPFQLCYLVNSAMLSVVLPSNLVYADIVEW